MKKILALLVLALALAACKTEVPETPSDRLQGRWLIVSINESHTFETIETIYWEFSGNEYRFYMN